MIKCVTEQLKEKITYFVSLSQIFHYIPCLCVSRPIVRQKTMAVECVLRRMSFISLWTGKEGKRRANYNPKGHTSSDLLSTRPNLLPFSISH
jgi:hypothetical protein